MIRIDPRFITWVTATLLLSWVLPHQTSAGTLSFVSQSRWVQVDKVFDGDTFRTRHGERIRLLGINTPEVAHDASPAQPMGSVALSALHTLISGKTVRLAFDEQHRDNYGRTLAQVYLRDGTWINGKMIEHGMAHVYTFTPNLHWAGELILLEKAAREANLGIWKTKRFAMLDASKVKPAHLGQFRVVRGKISRVSKNHFAFSFGKLKISIPRKYRPYFRNPLPVRPGEIAVVHGVVRSSSSGLYLALHTPFDLEKIAP